MPDDKSYDLRYFEKYKNAFLDEQANTFLSSKVKSGGFSKSTAKELESFFKTHTYSYVMSSRGNNWENEIIMLIIGAIASALISSFANSIYFTNFNLVIAVIFILLILIRWIRR